LPVIKFELHKGGKRNKYRGGVTHLCFLLSLCVNRNFVLGQENLLLLVSHKTCWSRRLMLSLGTRDECATIVFLLFW